MTFGHGEVQRITTAQWQLIGPPQPFLGLQEICGSRFDQAEPLLAELGECLASGLSLLRAELPAALVEGDHTRDFQQDPMADPEWAILLAAEPGFSGRIAAVSDQER